MGKTNPQPGGAGQARQATRPGVIIAALAAPLLAALVGGFLVFAIAAVFVPDATASADEIPSMLAGSLIVALAGLILSAPLTYVLGGPVMAIAWYLAHRQGWRSPGAMALVMAAAGCMFGAAVIGLIWNEPAMTLAGAAAGFLTGLPCGALISVIAYRQAVD
ncbi:MAG: hypothetical protein JJU18_02305 [Oceanicaulis sp.]|nr:hypothetical protein [Oceanicaulis sp.]